LEVEAAEAVVAASEVEDQVAAEEMVQEAGVSEIIGT